MDLPHRLECLAADVNGGHGPVRAAGRMTGQGARRKEQDVTTSDITVPRETAPPRAATGPVWPVLIAISLCHMINDILQSLLSAIYPLLKAEFALSYAQIGLMTFAFQVTASLLQPVVGMVTDRHPMPRSLAVGMLCSLAGALTLAPAGR